MSLNKDKIKQMLSPRMRRVLAQLQYYGLAVFHAPRCLTNKYIFRGTLLPRFSRLHLGCGGKRMAGFLNVDCRYTPATDIVHDCVNLGVFPDGHFSVVYSHAFFEHLFIEKRLACLKSIYRLLKNDGQIIFAGIPDFQRIASAYLGEEKGLISETFDLFHVYRFTHGAPEEVAGWWMAQLHKSLFDAKVVAELLTQAGFPSYVIFRYCFREEHLPINLGFVGFKLAGKGNLPAEELCRLLQEFAGDINIKTVQVLARK